MSSAGSVWHVRVSLLSYVMKFEYGLSFMWKDVELALSIVIVGQNTPSTTYYTQTQVSCYWCRPSWTRSSKNSNWRETGITVQGTFASRSTSCLYIPMLVPNTYGFCSSSITIFIAGNMTFIAALHQSCAYEWYLVNKQLGLLSISDS